ncbi:DUF2586 family protein [Arachidicoccus soli]|uniref:DUF2586 family protein n=1 Tax=Arachidicoccus soli TaxID=2341117 RepID=A0A386HSF8_9BACT|nr:DUF2586 family protein [Arachidicoccus soli]AYD48204.1 hypothetical protein D6B99_11710 [Arachidicoccus soli]
MGKPKVNLSFGNGNLLQDIEIADGIMGLIATGQTVGLQGVPMKINNLADAVTKGVTPTAEPAAYRHLQEFYNELGGNQDIWVLLLADSVTMTEAVTATNLTGAVALLNAAYADNTSIRVLGITRTPPVSYVGGTDFLDDDVPAAVTASKTLGDWALGKWMPTRFIIEGRVTNEGVENAYQPSAASVDYTGVLLGGSKNDGSASMGTLLGRAAKYSAEQKIGKVANGSLQIPQVYIGTKLLQNVTGLDALTDDGFITFIQQPQKAGFYFGFDYMANIADYRRLAYGRVTDKAALIAVAVYVNQLESEVDVDANGQIDDLDIQHLQTLILQQVSSNMGNQISGFSAYISPAQDVINTEALSMKLGVTPKGYLGVINIEIALNNPATS